MNGKAISKRLSEGNGPCSLCHDNGVVIYKPTLKSYPCVCQYLRDETRCYVQYSSPVSGLSDRMAPPTNPEHYNRLVLTTNALFDLVENFVSHRWLIIIGETGTGKTHMAYRAYERLTHSAIYTSAVALKDRVFETLEAETLGEYRRVLSEVPVLFLDDIGSENGSKFIRSFIADVLMERYALGLQRPTVLTINHKRVFDLEEYARVRSRLKDKYLVGTYHLLHPDYRPQRARPETAQ